jgi:hypothetical protein
MHKQGAKMRYQITYRNRARKDVVTRFITKTDNTLTAIERFEKMHGNKVTVIDAKPLPKTAITETLLDAMQDKRPINMAASKLPAVKRIPASQIIPPTIAEPKPEPKPEHNRRKDDRRQIEF